MMNHSCEPNCIVNFGRDSEVVINALRDIESGEELLISYVVETAPYEERQFELKSYGFECICKKCVVQKASAQEKEK